MTISFQNIGSLQIGLNLEESLIMLSKPLSYAVLSKIIYNTVPLFQNDYVLVPSKTLQNAVVFRSTVVGLDKNM